MSRKLAARIGGLVRQTSRDWLHAQRTALDGLIDGTSLDHRASWRMGARSRPLVDESAERGRIVDGKRLGWR